MATLVQQSAELFADNTSSIAPSITGVTAGNTVVMLVACSQSGTNTALTAPSGWSTAISTTGPTTNTFRQQVAVFYKENASSGSHSGTVTFANNSFAAAIICEFSGLKTSGALDTSNSQNGTATTSASTNTATNAQANSLVLAVLCVSSDAGVVTGLSTPASSGYTNIDGELNETSHTGYQFSYKNVSSSASQSGSWTWTNNGQYGAAVVIFQDAPVGPTITVDPVDQTVNNGATASFSVTATGGTAPLAYQWQDDSGGSFADISGATSNPYAPTASYAAQGRRYRCVVTDAALQTATSAAATLRVAFNTTGTGPRAYPILGGVIGAGSVESWLRGTDAGGAPSHSTSGALAAQASTLAGTAAHLTLHSTTGALTTQAATISGAAQHRHATAGALSSQASTLAGVAAHLTLHTTSGALAAQSADISGSAAHQHAANGAMSAQAATISGAADHTTAGLVHATSGALTAQDAALTGLAAHLTLHTTTGVLSAQAATIAGSAVHPHTSTGALAAQSATISGAATRPHTSSGALSAQSASISGGAIHGTAAHDAVGALAAGAASISGDAQGPATTDGGGGGSGGFLHRHKLLQAFKDKKERDEAVEKLPPVTEKARKALKGAAKNLVKREPLNYKDLELRVSQDLAQVGLKPVPNYLDWLLYYLRVEAYILQREQESAQEDEAIMALLLAITE